MDNRLIRKPEEKILNCVSSPFANHFGYLPVRLSRDGKTLEVIANEEIKFGKRDTLREKEMLRKKIKIVSYVGSEEWLKAFNLFYREFLPY